MSADREMIAQLQRESADYANRLDEWRTRAGEAIRLLHMLDRPDARHPDVAAFLDGLDDDPAPAWLDAPSGEGYWWVRGRTYDRIVSVSLINADPPRWLATGDDEGWEVTANNGYQWQRVAPPREG